MVTHHQLYSHQEQAANNNNEHEDLLSFLNSSTEDTSSNSAFDVRSGRKQRILSKSTSTRTTRPGPGPLDDPNFAPPPVRPLLEMKTSYEMNAEHEANYSKLPSYDKLRHSGNIMTRFSAVSLMTKKW